VGPGIGSSSKVRLQREYFALTDLQADAFVTQHVEPARLVDGIVVTASI
jgi:hypothetical protein